MRIYFNQTLHRMKLFYFRYLIQTRIINPTNPDHTKQADSIPDLNCSQTFVPGRDPQFENSRWRKSDSVRFIKGTMRRPRRMQTCGQHLDTAFVQRASNDLTWYQLHIVYASVVFRFDSFSKFTKLIGYINDVVAFWMNEANGVLYNGNKFIVCQLRDHQNYAKLIKFRIGYRLYIISELGN